MMLEALVTLLQSQYPTSQVQLEPPLRPEGVYTLDVWLNGYHLSLTKAQGNAYGLSWDSPESDVGYGDGPDHTYADLPLARIVELLDISNKLGPDERVRCPSCDGQSPSAEAMRRQMADRGDPSGACGTCDNAHYVSAPK